MPEKRFEISWPNGDQESCYSPSSIIERYLHEGETYSLEQFVNLTDKALNIASNRVQEKYGFSCSSAMDQLHRIKQTATD